MKSQIREAKTYVDMRGIMIVALSPIGSEEAEQFFGVAKVVMPIGGEEMRFPIPAASLEEAFDNYDFELKKFSEEFEKQMKANAAKENAETKEVATDPVA